MIDFACSECEHEFDCDTLSDVETDDDDLSVACCFNNGQTGHGDMCLSDADPGL